VQSGAIEIGVAGINQIARRLPAADIMEQPFLFNFEALTRAATSPDSEMRKLLDKAVLETIGVHVLWWQTAGSQVFISKGFDLAEPSRLKDKKVRAFSGTSASFATLCGGRPQVLSITKVHDFLKDGVIDAVMTVPTAVETRQLWKVADTITRTDHAGFEFLVIVNAKTWAGLGDRHRRIILKAARRAERDVRSASARLEEQAYAFARSKGMIAHALTPDQVAEWRACTSEVLDDYMSRGGELERRLLAAYGKLRTDPCCSAGPETGGSFSRR
jgi:C4-dicarboxylate-binding protein DctP